MVTITSETTSTAAKIITTTKELKQFREYLKEKPNKFSSKLIGNEVVTLTSENPSPEDYFETKL